MGLGHVLEAAVHQVYARLLLISHYETAQQVVGAKAQSLVGQVHKTERLADKKVKVHRLEISVRRSFGCPPS